MFASGFSILVFATFCIDHFRMYGLSQAFRSDISAALGLSAPSNSDGAAQRRVFVPLPAHISLSRSHLHAWPLLSRCASHHVRLLAWRDPPVVCDLAPSSPCSLVSDAGFWATPIMNGSRFLFAAFNSIYCVSAVKLLEGIFAVGLCKYCVSCSQSLPAFYRATPAKSARSGVFQVRPCCSIVSQASQMKNAWQPPLPPSPP